MSESLRNENANSITSIAFGIGEKAVFNLLDRISEIGQTGPGNDEIEHFEKASIAALDNRGEL